MSEIKTFSDYITESNLTEHLVDSMPQMIFIMGLPAAGKSTFISLDLPKYFPAVKQNRTLDVDVQLLKKQKDSAEQFASEIYYKANTEESFNKIILNKENEVNNSDAMYGRNKFKITTTYQWFIENKDLPLKKFIYKFITTFYKLDWASNFEVRPDAKQDFKKVIKDKLSSLVDLDNIESFNDNDLIIPVTGDKVSKILDFIEMAKNKYAVSIIYLDMPVEIAIEKDEGRRKKEGRAVGSGLIKEKAPLIEQSWSIFKTSFKRYGIYKLLHFVWLPIEGKWGEYRLQKQYINTKIIKDYISK